MAPDPTPPPATDPPPTPPPTPPAPGFQTVDPNPTPPPATPPAQPTQAQLDAAVAAALGMPLADVKKQLKAAEDARKAQMSEAERAAAEAAEAKTKADAATAEAARTAFTARVQIALVRAGVHPDKLEWAARLIVADPAADDKALQAAIDAAKAAVPEVFAGQSSGTVPPPGGGTPPPSSNPPGSPPPPKPTPDVKQKAAALIAERFPNLGGDKK